MFDWLFHLGESIILLISFFIDTIKAIIDLFTKIPTYVSLLTNSLAYIPSWVLPFATAFISIAILQYWLNRKAD